MIGWKRSLSEQLSDKIIVAETNITSVNVIAYCNLTNLKVVFQALLQLVSKPLCLN